MQKKTNKQQQETDFPPVPPTWQAPQTEDKQKNIANIINMIMISRTYARGGIQPYCISFLSLTNRKENRRAADAARRGRGLLEGAGRLVPHLPPHSRRERGGLGELAVSGDSKWPTDHPGCIRGYSPSHSRLDSVSKASFGAVGPSGSG